jgi:small-conductance mechanosensitive channel
MMAFEITGSPALDTALLALAAIVLALAGQALVFAVLLRIFGRRPVAGTLLRCVMHPTAWVVAALAVSAVLDESPNVFGNGVSHALSLAVIVGLTWLAVRGIRALVDIVLQLNPADVSDNLHARAVRTQANVIGRTLTVLVVVVGLAAALLTFPGVRQVGATLLASAGVAGLVVGLAARPVLSNLMAGLQIALTQPIRIDDVLIVKGEWGRVEELTGAYVVMRIWDERRLVIPLNWFIENPFENWTRSSSQLIGSIFWWFDYTVPVDALREEFMRQVKAAPEWDGRVAALQVTDANERAVQVRALASAADAGKAFDLRCRLREGMLAYVQREFASSLPRVRLESAGDKAPESAPV